MSTSLTSFVNSPEYLMLSSQDREIKETELIQKEKDIKNGEK